MTLSGPLRKVASKLMVGLGPQGLKKATERIPSGGFAAIRHPFGRSTVSPAC